MTINSSYQNIQQLYMGWGIEVFKHETGYFIRWDDGSIVTHLRDDEVTKEEAEKVAISEQDAYEVLVAIQKRIRTRRYL